MARVGIIAQRARAMTALEILVRNMPKSLFQEKLDWIRSQASPYTVEPDVSEVLRTAFDGGDYINPQEAAMLLAFATIFKEMGI